MRILLLGAILAAAGCNREPQWYPVPEQHSPPSGPEMGAGGTYFYIGDERAEAHIISGLQDMRTGWRWSTERIELRFRLPSTAGKTFQMRFAVHDATFKDTGPITLAYFINGQALARERYTTPGDKTFRKAVPAGWLATDAENTLVVEIDKPWIAPGDGAKLGIIFNEAGFVD